MVIIGVVIAIIIVLAIAYYLITGALGYYFPIYSGRHYLRQELKKHGVEVTLIPDECLDELIEPQYNAAKISNRKTMIYYKDSLDALAIDIRKRLTEGGSKYGLEQASVTVIDETLIDYGVIEKEEIGV